MPARVAEDRDNGRERSSRVKLPYVTVGDLGVLAALVSKTGNDRELMAT